MRKDQYTSREDAITQLRKVERAGELLALMTGSKDSAAIQSSATRLIEQWERLEGEFYEWPLHERLMNYSIAFEGDHIESDLRLAAEVVRDYTKLVEAHRYELDDDRIGSIQFDEEVISEGVRSP